MTFIERGHDIEFMAEVIDGWLTVYERAEKVYEALPEQVKAAIRAQDELDVGGLAAVLAMRAPALRERTRRAMLLALGLSGPPTPPRRRRPGRCLGR